MTDEEFPGFEGGRRVTSLFHRYALKSVDSLWGVEAALEYLERTLFPVYGIPPGTIPVVHQLAKDYAATRIENLAPISFWSYLRPTGIEGKLEMVHLSARVMCPQHRIPLMVTIIGNN